MLDIIKWYINIIFVYWYNKIERERGFIIFNLLMGKRKFRKVMCYD